MKNRLIISLLYIFLNHFPAFAQVNDTTVQHVNVLTDIKEDTNKITYGYKYEIKGIIKDKKTKEPVPFATVFFPHSPIGSPADLDGNFVLSFDTVANDTLRVEAIGYKPVNLHMDSNEHKPYFIIEMEQSANMLKEVVVTASNEDPAIALLKKIIARKKYNDPDRFDNYSFETYNKLEIDLLHLSKNEFEKLPLPYLKNFSYIYNNLDTSGKEPNLPFYLTETVSDFYYQRKPHRTKEFIKATQIKGINNQNITNSLSKYLGNTFVAINPYDNYLLLFDKQFVSPINNAGPTFYKYKIEDTEKIDGYDVYEVSFKPLRKGENCLTGTFKVVDSFYALQYINAEIPKEANLNWIRNASFYKEYELLDSVWFCNKENFTAEILSTGELLKLPAFIARRTNSYKNVSINDPYVAKVVNNKKNKADIIITDSASHYSEDFWDNARHEKLNKNEQAIYNMLDTLEHDKLFIRFRNLAKFLVSGVYKTGPIELGPYWSIYSSNAVEGSRFRFSMGTTPKFSKDVYVNGYIAYGVKDQRFKYNINTLWLLNRDFPRSYLYVSYTYDLDHSVNYYDQVSFDNTLNLFIRKKWIPQKFVFAEDFRVEAYKEYFNGFSHMLTFLHKEYNPYAPLPNLTIFSDMAGKPAMTVNQTEVNLRLRYAYKEKFLNGNYYRTSLGSKYPIPELRYAYGIKGVWNSAYEYHRITFSISDDVRIAPFGTLYFNVFCGKYFGILPYPLLQIHPGNETYYYNKYAFNMMEQYEFLSDQYAGFNLEHLFGGGVFKYIPGIRKLKLRQFWTAKGVIGSLSDENKALNLNKGYTFRTLQGNPYIEVGTGIENILRLFRIDFVWRVTPKALPSEAQDKYFGIFGSLKVTF
jgi:hypothetical protein